MTVVESDTVKSPLLRLPGGTNNASLFNRAATNISQSCATSSTPTPPRLLLLRYMAQLDPMAIKSPRQSLTLSGPISSVSGSA
jgi:hypothetical protein